MLASAYVFAFATSPPATDCEVLVTGRRHLGMSAQVAGPALSLAGRSGCLTGDSVADCRPDRKGVRVITPSHERTLVEGVVLPQSSRLADYAPL